MKKVLFATTALIATAGIASADVTVGGFGYVGVQYSDKASAANQAAATAAAAAAAAAATAANAAVAAGTGTVGAATAAEAASATAAAAAAAAASTSTSVAHATRLTFSGSVETDSGVSFTASSRITISDNNDNGQLGHNKITVKSGGLTLAVGATHGAMKTTARVATFHGFDNGGLYYAVGGSGVDNNVSSHNDSGNNVLVSYSSGDFRVAASADVAGTTQELAASYTFNNFTIAAGVDTGNQWMLAAKYNGGNWNVGLGTNDNSDIVLTAGYDISDATSIGFGVDAASGGTINAVGLQVSHDLGGADIIGAVGQVGGNRTVASLGVMFSF